MSRTLVAAVLTLLTAATLAALPSVAHAQKWTGGDATGDARAWQLDPDDICGGSDTTSDSTPGEDITGMTVRHQPRKVVVRLRYAAPASTTHRIFDLHVATAHRKLAVDVRRWHDGGRWRVYVSREPHWSEAPIDTDQDGITDCTAWTSLESIRDCSESSVDLADRVVTVALPRECLGSPRWVRVGAESWGRAGENISIGDEWGTSDPASDPSVITYGDRVRVGPGQSGSPSNRSRVASSSTGTLRSFVISRTGFPIGTTAATAY